MRILLAVVLFCVSAMFSIGVNAAHASSPVGLWKTIDDVTGKPKAIVKVWQTADKKLYGKIIRVLPRPGVDTDAVCTACKGKQHNHSMTGLVFLENLKKSEKSHIKWSGGNILDPKTGKNYHCSLQLAENGQKMNVRGYLGLPLFGRTQTWVRKTSPTASA